MRMYRIGYTGLNNVPGTALTVVECLQEYKLEVRRGFIGEAVPNVEAAGGMPFRGIFKAVCSEPLLSNDNDNGVWTVKNEQEWMETLGEKIKLKLEAFYKKSGHQFEDGTIHALVDKLAYKQEHYYYSCQLKCVNEVGLIYQLLSGLDRVATPSLGIHDNINRYRDYFPSISGMFHLPVYKINDNGMSCIIDFHCRINLHPELTKDFYQQWDGFSGDPSISGLSEPSDLLAKLNFRRWVASEIQDRLAAVFERTNGVISYTIKQTSPFSELPERVGHRDVKARQHIERGESFILRYDIPARVTGITQAVANELRQLKFNIYRGFMAEVPQTDPAPYNEYNPRSAAFKVYLPKGESNTTEDRDRLQIHLNKAVRDHLVNTDQWHENRHVEVYIDSGIELLPQENISIMQFACQLTVSDQKGALLSVLESIAKVAVSDANAGEKDKKDDYCFELNIDHLILLANRLEKSRKEGIIELKLKAKLYANMSDSELTVHAEQVRDAVIDRFSSIPSVLSVTCKPTSPSALAAGFISRKWHSVERS